MALGAGACLPTCLDGSHNPQFDIRTECIRLYFPAAARRGGGPGAHETFCFTVCSSAYLDVPLFCVQRDTVEGLAAKLLAELPGQVRRGAESNMSAAASNQ